ncbi:Hypothetical predicted protein [Cloeon dipterum]|uniref:SCP domain-containing protein n=1 Tax=Cloeon dipterum TaxID=197152 RepID=A0A8S1DAB9_9INSE|nr:Hypothetical predicted protein [Cloeon dipterum]
MGVLTRILLLVLSLVIGSGLADKKDGNETCQDERYAKYPNHVMCLKPRSCPGKDLKVVKYKSYDMLAVLHALNTFRSVIASGGTAVYRPATNMRQLTWDEELATLAQRLAEHCDREAKLNLTVDRFAVGHIIMTSKQLRISWGHLQPPHFMWLIKSLFVQAFDYSYLLKDIPRWVPTPNGDYLSQLIWAESHLVGCGYSLFMEGKTGVRMLVCLFGPKGNVVNSRVYEEGEPNCAVPSSYYEGLCTDQAANRAFQPIPCDNSSFATKYRVLCAPKDNYLRWISTGLPYLRTPCDESFWRKMFYATVAAVLITLLALVLGAFLIYYVKKNVFIV